MCLRHYWWLPAVRLAYTVMRMTAECGSTARAIPPSCSSSAWTVSSSRYQWTVLSTPVHNRFRSAIAKGRYRKSPRDTCRTVKLKLTLTLVLTLTDTGGAVLTLMLAGYSIQKFIHYMAIATFAIADCHHTIVQLMSGFHYPWTNHHRYHHHHHQIAL